MFLTLRRDGALDGPLLPPLVRARLDDRGCVRGDGMLWVDASDPAVVWTQRDVYPVDGAKGLQIGEHRTLRILPDGTVTGFLPDGGIGSGPRSSFFFRGYHADSARDARVLLVTLFAMMPGMGDTDGHFPDAPRPAHSQCGPSRRASVAATQ